MTKHSQTAANTRHAFASIAAMLAAFSLFVTMMLLPLGLTAGAQAGLMWFSPCAIVLFAALDGILSARVTYLRKENGVQYDPSR